MELGQLINDCRTEGIETVSLPRSRLIQMSPLGWACDSHLSLVFSIVISLHTNFRRNFFSHSCEQHESMSLNMETKKVAGYTSICTNTSYRFPPWVCVVPSRRLLPLFYLLTTLLHVVFSSSIALFISYFEFFPPWVIVFL